MLIDSDIRDIHDVLEITVYDEDKDHKYEFLGKVLIPLLRIKNGERRWFKLKDKSLMKKAKGEDAEILIDMLKYNLKLWRMGRWKLRNLIM